VPHGAFFKENEGGKGKFVLKITTALTFNPSPANVENRVSS
jgi:hypothetical protein